MIVRILEDGQYDLPESACEALSKLDAELDRAIREHDEVSYTATLAALLNEVHTSASKLGADTIVPSELTIPAAGSSIDEVRRLLDGEQAEN
jgi:hypothetical protein